MTDTDELRKLAEAAEDPNNCASGAWTAFKDACHPSTILAVFDHLQAVEAERDEAQTEHTDMTWQRRRADERAEVAEAKLATLRNTVADLYIERDQAVARLAEARRVIKLYSADEECGMCERPVSSGLAARTFLKETSHADVLLELANEDSQ